MEHTPRDNSHRDFAYSWPTKITMLAHGAKVSGCTVHFADNVYDHGPIILQKVVPVLDEDSADSLAARVFEQECEAYPEAIHLFAEGRLKIEDRRVRILPGATR
jgi:phosphoribosylglycinamide formyltransferase 1